MGICPHVILLWEGVVDRVHSLPFGKARAEVVVLLEAVTQPVETLGDRLARCMCERLRAFVDLDAGNDVLRGKQLPERRPAESVMSNRLDDKDGAADVLLDAGRREE